MEKLIMVGMLDIPGLYEQGRRVYSPEGICPTLHTMGGGNTEIKIMVTDKPILVGGFGEKKSNNLTTVQKDSCVVENLENIRIRMLTPKECWRLMAFDDESFGRAEKVNSKTQLYKQAGNSICVNVLEAIFGEMFDGHEKDYKEHWG